MGKNKKQYGSDRFQVLSDKMGDNQFAKISATCKDCHRPLTVNLERKSPTDIEIKDGVVIAIHSNGDFVFKCPECFANDEYFGQEMLIYSRVVGYLRPVNDWNDGKQEEYRHRKVLSPLPKGEDFKKINTLAR